MKLFLKRHLFRLLLPGAYLGLLGLLTLFALLGVPPKPSGGGFLDMSLWAVGGFILIMVPSLFWDFLESRFDVRLEGIFESGLFNFFVMIAALFLLGVLIDFLRTRRRVQAP